MGVDLTICYSELSSGVNYNYLSFSVFSCFLWLMIISLIQLLHLKIVEECLLYAAGWVKHFGSSYLILIASQFCNLLVFVSFSVQLEMVLKQGEVK